MDTLVLPIDAATIARAAAVLRAGGLVAFPTETVYGLGANALDAAAVRRIFEAKGRPARNPLIVHIAEASEALRVVAAWPETAARLAERFWPGPLTLVLPRRSEVPDVVTGGGATVAVRVPAHPVAQALLRAAGVPVAAPSANRSTRLSPTRAEHILHELGGRIDLILDGGPTPGGIESTVLDVMTVPPRLLRPGLVEAAALETIVGRLAPLPPTPSQNQRGGDAPLPSPGMLERHYAPRTPLECIEMGGRERAEALAGAGQRVAWVTCGAAPADAGGAGTMIRELPPDPIGYAAQLYAVLHQLDAAGLDCIVVSLPPDTAEWLAVRDRLLRASARD